MMYASVMGCLHFITSVFYPWCNCNVSIQGSLSLETSLLSSFEGMGIDRIFSIMFCGWLCLLFRKVSL